MVAVCWGLFDPHIPVLCVESCLGFVGPLLLLLHEDTFAFEANPNNRLRSTPNRELEPRRRPGPSYLKFVTTSLLPYFATN